jgi:hypothetical protein
MEKLCLASASCTAVDRCDGATFMSVRALDVLQRTPFFSSNLSDRFPFRCLAIGCKGYRRKTMEGDEEVLYFESKGPVSPSSSPFLVQCAEQKTQALAAIADLSSKLLRSCQALFSKPMDVQCFIYLN